MGFIEYDFDRVEANDKARRTLKGNSAMVIIPRRKLKRFSASFVFLYVREIYLQTHLDQIA